MKNKWRKVLSNEETNLNEFMIIVSPKNEELVINKAKELGMKLKGRNVQIGHANEILLEGTYGQFHRLIDFRNELLNGKKEITR